MIPTDETARQMFFLEAFLTHQKPLLLIGPTGTGKSAITNNYIIGMPREKYDWLAQELFLGRHCQKTITWLVFVADVKRALIGHL